jgi:hypothetical protein|tara:strand:- start:1499 stop:2461 length:963 start_codon:yes stop_codon:yes gene_type:complete
MTDAAHADAEANADATSADAGDAANADAANKNADDAAADDKAAADKAAADKGKGAANDAPHLEGITDDKTRQLAARYTSGAAMADALMAANQELSQRVKVPGEDASDEDRAAFAKAMGAPDKPEDYKYAKPDHLDDEAFAAEDLQGAVTAVSSAMHTAGASQAVIDAMMTSYWEIDAAARAEQVKADEGYVAEAEAALRKEWGSGYDENVAHGVTFLDAHPELKNLELANGMMLSSLPAFIKAGAEAGRLKNEGQLQLGLAGSEAGVDLQEEYDKLTREMHEAHDKGDSILAKSIDAKRRPLSDKLHGTQPAVGEQGRTA